jgi:predicted phage replisome organizer
MDVTWIKLKTSLFDDEKIKVIQGLPDGDSILLLWIRILILAGKSNRSGYLTISDNLPYNDQMLSSVIGKSESFIRMSMKTLINLGMVNDENGTYCIENWEKHQNIDGLDHVRKQTAERMRKMRQKRLLSEHNTNDCNAQCDVTCDVTESEISVTVTEQSKIKSKNKNIDIDKEKESKERSEKHLRVFTMPSIENVIDYFLEKGSKKEEAERYFDYYTSNGWMVGKSKMKNWQAAANNWMRNLSKFNTTNGKSGKSRDENWARFINGQ